MRYYTNCLFLWILSAAFCYAASGRGGQFQLAIDATSHQVSDAASGREIKVIGGEVVPDDRFKQCLSFGNDSTNKIVIKDNPVFDFTNGFTFEAWLKFDADSAEEVNGAFFVKHGTSVTKIKRGRIDVSWFVFPKEKVFAEEGQIDYYPVAPENFNGARDLPLGEWVHVAITYDPVLKVIRTWIDGAVDRDRYLVAEEPMPLLSNQSSTISLFEGLKNFQVADIRILPEAKALGPLPAMQVYAHQLPYAKKAQVGLLIDHIDPALKFPITITVSWENHTGAGSVIKRFQLDGPDRRTELVDVPGWQNDRYTMIVQAYEKNREVFHRQIRMVNPAALANAPVRIEPDLNLSVGGKTIYPIMIYRVPPGDLQTAKDMGFNIATPYDWKVLTPRFTPSVDEAYQSWFTAAKMAGILLLPPFKEEAAIKFRDEKTLLGWNTADEPWGLGIERLRDMYNVSKLLAPSTPVYIVQNNSSRVQETTEGADIIARDPYPVPSVPFRIIADETKQTIRDTGGLKPVWTVVCQYETKVPSLEQLRCMLYLAIVSGANGVGVYSWDDRVANSKTGGSSGWYLPEHPEAMQNLRSVISELAAMQSVLIVPNASDIAQGSSDNKAIHVALKRAPDADYLFVVNDARQSEQATITLGDDYSAQGSDIHAADHQITFTSGKASVDLPAYGASVYRFAKGALK